MITQRVSEWCGYALLFVSYDFLCVGVAGALLLLLSGEDVQGYIAIGTACVVGASAAYAARVGLEDGRWERLYMPVLPAILAAVFAVSGIADADGITVVGVLLGLLGTLVAASVFAVLTTFVHLLIRRTWNQDTVTGA